MLRLPHHDLHAFELALGDEQHLNDAARGFVLAYILLHGGCSRRVQKDFRIDRFLHHHKTAAQQKFAEISVFAQLLRCFDREIEVWNRGGAVHCRPARTAEGLLTLLSGNAAFEAAGTLEVGEEGLTVIGSTPIDPPQAQQALATEIRRRMREEYGLTITDSHD